MVLWHGRISMYNCTIILVLFMINWIGYLFLVNNEMLKNVLNTEMWIYYTQWRSQPYPSAGQASQCVPVLPYLQYFPDCPCFLGWFPQILFQILSFRGGRLRHWSFPNLTATQWLYTSCPSPIPIVTSPCPWVRATSSIPTWARWIPIAGTFKTTGAVVFVAVGADEISFPWIS